MAKVTGRVEILVNGQLLLNKSGAKASGIGVSGRPNFALKMIQGDTGPHGYVEEPVPARCEVTVTDRDDIGISDLANIRENGTLIFRSAMGGKVYILEGATCLRNFTLTGGEGEIEVVFEGAYWVEQTQQVIG